MADSTVNHNPDKPRQITFHGHRFSGLDDRITSAKLRITVKSEKVKEAIQTVRDRGGFCAAEDDGTVNFVPGRWRI